MKKHFITIMMLVALFSISLQAKEETGYIHIEAKVPESFTQRTLMVNFWLEDGANALYNVHQINEYKISQIMPAGKHTLDFVSINDDPTGRYKVKANETIHIKPGYGTIYKIEIIDTKAHLGEDADKINLDEVIEQIKKVNGEEEVEREAADETPVVQEELSQVEVIEEEVTIEHGKRSFIYRNRYTLSIITALGLVLGGIKLKKILFKD